MLFVYSGSNREKVLGRKNTLLQTLLSKRPDAELFEFNSDTFALSALDELLAAQGLFESKYIIVLHDVLAEMGEGVVARLQELKDSPHPFVFIEETIKDTFVPDIKKHAREYHDETIRIVEKQKNLFYLGDLFGKRDKKNLWLALREETDADVSLEELHGILVWAVKSMLLACKTGSATEAGLKPFVYSKFKKYAANFTETELMNIYDELVTMYHASHAGKVDFERELEKFMLGL